VDEGEFVEHLVAGVAAVGGGADGGVGLGPVGGGAGEAPGVVAELFGDGGGKLEIRLGDDGAEVVAVENRFRGGSCPSSIQEPMTPAGVLM